MTSFDKLYKELRTVRTTWKKEAGHKSDRLTPGINFVDGIVFGLTLALNVIDKHRRMKP